MSPIGFKARTEVYVYVCGGRGRDDNSRGWKVVLGSCDNNKRGTVIDTLHTL